MLVALLALLGPTVAALVRPVGHLVSTVLHGADEREELPPGEVDDASRLNRTRSLSSARYRVDHHDPEGRIAHLLARARTEGRMRFQPQAMANVAAHRQRRINARVEASAP